MNMIVRTPWNMLDQWHNEMGQLLSTPSGRDDTSLVEGSDWSPAVDIKEEDERFLIHADIPGISADEIEVSMDQGVLTIKGERKHESTEGGKDYKRLERSHGVFIRRFSLPDTVDADNISASSQDGVLEVILPKSAPQVSRRIEVSS